MVTLDVGTTSVKTCIFDENFRLLDYDSQEYSLLTPEKDIVELDPNIYWEASVRGIRRVIRGSGADPEDIMVITPTTQGETLILVHCQLLNCG